jgi:hypothetical protein
MSDDDTATLPTRLSTSASCDGVIEDASIGLFTRFAKSIAPISGDRRSCRSLAPRSQANVSVPAIETTMNTANDAARDATLLSIAKRHTCFETLETRNRDSLDFHEVSAEGLRRALADAYEAGRAAATRDSGMRELLRRLPPDSAGLLAAMANTYRTTGGPHLDRRSVLGLTPEAVRETLDLAEADAAANSGEDARRLVADLKRSLGLA